MADKVITLPTDAVTAGSQEDYAFTIPSAFYKYGNPVIIIDGLAGTETVSLWKYTSGSGEDAVWTEVSDSSGTQIAFTATANDHSFNGGRQFGLTKTASAATLTLRLEDPRG